MLPNLILWKFTIESQIMNNCNLKDFKKIKSPEIHTEPLQSLKFSDIEL